MIIAGGHGGRLGEVTHKIAKSMEMIEGKQILWYMLRIYSH